MLEPGAVNAPRGIHRARGAQVPAGSRRSTPNAPLATRCYFELGQCYRRTDRATACGATAVLAEGLPWLAYAASRAGRPTRIAFADMATRIIRDIAVVAGRNHIGGDSDLPRDSRQDPSIFLTQGWVRRN